MIIGVKQVKRISVWLLPFSDAASPGLPLGQLLRLSLFQVSVGMAAVLLLGTLNRVMIVELGVTTTIVAVMIALPVLIAPFRALLGFRSDTYKSAIGWRRAPYLWFGSLWQMGGLAVMPFALILLSGDQFHGPAWAGEAIAAVAFLFTGLGLHMTQTAGLALAADKADDETRPRVVTLLYVMFLLGMAISSIIIGWLLTPFSDMRLIQVVQGAAALTLILNIIALWRQESIRPMSREERAKPRPLFRDAWADYSKGGQAGRLLVLVFLGAMAFNMQDVLLEPFGGEVLGLPVAATTLLTAVWAIGALIGFAAAGRWLATGFNPYLIASRGLLAGVAAFSIIIFASPLQSPALLFIGATGIGFGGGLFAVATLTAAMVMPVEGVASRGLALGAWGAAQATGAGLSIAIGGGVRDFTNQLVGSDPAAALLSPAAGYMVVYHIEIGLLFVTLAALGPLVRAGARYSRPKDSASAPIGLAEFPG